MGAAESVPQKARGGMDERVPLAPLHAAASADLGGGGGGGAPGSPRAVLVSESDDEYRSLASGGSAPGTPATPSGSEGGHRMRMLVLMSDTGGGHRASADALDTAIAQLDGAEGGVDLSIVDFWTCIAGFPFHNFPQQYSYIAKRPMMWYSVYLWAKFPPTRWLTETAFSVFCYRKVRRYFEEFDADIIVSVHPLVNTLSLSVLDGMRRQTALMTPPYVTVVTDLGGAHPTWFDARSDAVYVPSDPLRATAVESGVRPERIRMFGLPIRAAFWTESRSRMELRTDLGMALEMPAVLLVGGGDGIGGLLEIATAIAVTIASQVGDSGGQLVVVCGKNKRLLSDMQSQSWPIPVILKGFVGNMSEWMSACDVLCSKAGPGTIAEAWTRGLPIVITGFLPGQEEGNVKLVTESGSGEYHDSPAGIAECAARIVGDPELRGAMAQRARELGRPNSTRQIAADIWDLAVNRTRLRVREASIIRGRAATGVPTITQNGYLAMARYYLVTGSRYLRRGMFLGGARDNTLVRPV